MGKRYISGVSIPTVLYWTPIDSADLDRMLIILGSRHQSREIEITNPGKSYHTAS